MTKYFKRPIALFMTIFLLFSLCTPAALAEGDPETDVAVFQSEPEPVGDETAAPTAEESGAVSYVVVNKPTVATPDNQEILIGLDAANAADWAVLTVRNEATGETADYEAAELTEGAVLFRIDCTAEQAGTYTLESIRYCVDGAQTEAGFADIGVTAVYGVDAQADSEPDAMVVSDAEEADAGAEPDVVFDVTTIDNGGDTQLSDSVEQALSDAAADADTSNTVSAQSMDEAMTAAVQSAGANAVVVLDPGHGTIKSKGAGLDPGASYTYKGVKYQEKDLTLKIAQYCKAELETYAGVKVYMTREGDVTDKVVTIKDRVDIAHSYGADVLVSIHLNSAGGDTTSAHGAEVYYPNTNGANSSVSSEGKKLGAEILKQLTALGLTTHGGEDGLHIRNSTEDSFEDGSKQDYYGINRYSKEYGFPGIIVEHAYLNNESDFQHYLSSDEKLQKLGVADATGIANYLGLSKGSSDPVTVYNGMDYSDVYDYNYYIEKYPDVAKQCNYDDQKVLNYFVEKGMTQAQQASAEFDPVSYRYEYANLRQTYGNTWAGYYHHYIRWGKSSGLHGTGCTQCQGYATGYAGDGLDYAAVYDYNYYIAKYPGLDKQFGYDDQKVLNYFVEQGMAQAQQASAEFDPVSYRNEYADLRQTYGSAWAGYYRHYVRWGKAAGLHGTGCTQLQGYATYYAGDGLDYAAVYDYNYYIDKYPNVAKQCNYDDQKVLNYFVEEGMAQAQQASAEFDPVSYRNEYADLRQTYGSAWAGYYRHYVRWGKAAGLHGTGCTERQGYVTYYAGDGLDYAPVYDYNYYTAQYPDVAKQCGYDDQKVLNYFVEQGMAQAQQASAEFDPVSYRNEYADLRQTYGSAWAGYYRHYVRWGKAAGLHGTGCTQLQGYATYYAGDGLDYAPVYDYNYYTAQYPDVAKQCNYDDQKVLNYFVEQGMAQAQRASAEFDPVYYRNSNPNLQATYGTVWAGYYQHYIRWGKAAGLQGASDTEYHVIASAATATASQMAGLFTSKKASFDESLYGMTLNQFCQLYAEECQSEGIDPAVAFCQAMIETGWLKYGGQVKAEQLNFAGIKNADGSAFATFSSVREGIRAQVQHLKAYASTDVLKNPCVDPRFNLVKRGSAPYVEWLGADANPNGTGWTPDEGYGKKIIDLMDQLYRI